MSVDAAIVFFREHFQVLALRITGKPYGVRFVAAPYNEAALSRLVYTDSRNPEFLSGPTIVSLLEKFGISEDEFKKDYNESHAEDR